MTDDSNDIILKTLARLLIPFILMYALYVEGNQLSREKGLEKDTSYAFSVAQSTYRTSSCVQIVGRVNPRITDFSHQKTIQSSEWTTVRSARAT